MDTRFLQLKGAASKRAYITAITHLESYIDSSAKNCTQEKAIDYIAEFRHCHSDASVKHRYHLLRSYFEYLVNMGEVQRNVFRIIPTLMSLRQSNQVRPTKTLSSKEIKLILGSISLETAEERRRFVLMGLLFGGGLRRGEAVGLRGCNVILGRPGRQCAVELRHTKAGVTQIQPIPDWLSHVVKQVLNDNMQVGISGNSPLLQMSDSTAYRLFKATCLRNGIDAAPHSFRAAAATLMKEAGEEDREVADFLRHKTTHMVQVYDHRLRSSQAKPKKCIENIFNFKKKFG